MGSLQEILSLALSSGVGTNCPKAELQESPNTVTRAR